jgi:hypothetical protein
MQTTSTLLSSEAHQQLQQPRELTRLSNSASRLIALPTVLLDEIFSYVPIELHDARDSEKNRMTYINICHIVRKVYTIRKWPVGLVISMRSERSTISDLIMSNIQQYTPIVSLQFTSLYDFADTSLSNILTNGKVDLRNVLRSTLKTLKITFRGSGDREKMDSVETLIRNHFPFVTSLSIYPYNTKSYISTGLFDVLHENEKKSGTRSTFNGFYTQSRCSKHHRHTSTLVLVPHCDAYKCRKYGKMVCLSCESPGNTVKCLYTGTCAKLIHPQCGVTTRCAMCILSVRSSLSNVHPRNCRCNLCIMFHNCGSCERLSLNECIVCTTKLCKKS